MEFKAGYDCKFTKSKISDRQSLPIQAVKMEEPPLKRPRVDQVVDKKDEWDPVVPSANDDLEFKYTREADVGITEFLNRDFEGFDCILKYR